MKLKVTYVCNFVKNIIIILFVHFKSRILHMLVVVFRKANIYKETLAANSPIDHVTCHMSH